MTRKPKTIITCAIHTPTMSDALPYTPDDIASQAVAAAAAEAGASVLHLHARNPETGVVSINPDDFAAFLPRIKQATDAVISRSIRWPNATTAGSSTGKRLTSRSPTPISSATPSAISPPSPRRSAARMA